MGKCSLFGGVYAGVQPHSSKRDGINNVGCRRPSISQPLGYCNGMGEEGGKGEREGTPAPLRKRL